MVGVAFASGFSVLRLSISEALPMFDYHEVWWLDIEKQFESWLLVILLLYGDATDRGKARRSKERDAKVLLEIDKFRIVGSIFLTFVLITGEEDLLVWLGWIGEMLARSLTKSGMLDIFWGRMLRTNHMQILLAKNQSWWESGTHHRGSQPGERKMLKGAFFFLVGGHHHALAVCLQNPRGLMH